MILKHGNDRHIPEEDIIVQNLLRYPSILVDLISEVTLPKKMLKINVISYVILIHAKTNEVSIQQILIDLTHRAIETPRPKCLIIYFQGLYLENVWEKMKYVWFHFNFLDLSVLFRLLVITILLVTHSLTII